MKTLLLSTADIKGGAGRAAYRLHQGLQKIGVDSQMLVQYKYSDDKKVIAPTTRLDESLARIRTAVDGLPKKFYPQRQKTPFALRWLPDSTIPKIAQLKPDIINIHWIGEAFLQVETLGKLNRPMVWTLHDMWAFTGGCLYSGECDRYRGACGKCPQLGSTQEWDLSRWVWQRKAKAWKDLNWTIVTPSTWLANCARSSSLFQNMRVKVIPHGIDLQKYKPINQQVARELLNLPQNKQIVLFGAINAMSNQRKGFQLLLPALQKLHQAGWQDQIELVIFGASEPENPVNSGLRTHYLGQLNDALTLAVVYSAANVMLVPSKQEAFGQTALESLACGTPVVAFAKTGLNDIVDHQQNGYLAQPFEIEDLARGIIWVLENKERYQKLCTWARKKAETEFYLELQAHRYASLFAEILESPI